MAEVGPDMQQFPTSKHLASWAGVCPGNNRSAGKSKGSKTTHGSRWLRAALTGSAWGAGAKKNCFLKEEFWRLATKKQRKAPAVVAIGHSLLMLVYRVLSTRRPYEERGQPILDEKHRNRIIRHHVRRLGRLGVRVHSAPLPQGHTKRRARRQAK